MNLGCVIGNLLDNMEQEERGRRGGGEEQEEFIWNRIRAGKRKEGVRRGRGRLFLCLESENARDESGVQKQTNVRRCSRMWNKDVDGSNELI